MKNGKTVEDPVDRDPEYIARILGGLGAAREVLATLGCGVLADAVAEGMEVLRRLGAAPGL